jgi:hypothetical protein
MDINPKEPIITVTLSIGEATALRQLLHFALQARGLDVAEAALHFTKKLETAVESLQAQGNPVSKTGNGSDQRAE